MHACSVTSDSLWPHGLYPARLLCLWGSPGKNTGVGCRFLLQRIFLTQGSNPPLLLLLHWQADSLPAVPPGKPSIVRSAVDVSGVVGIYFWHWTLTLKTSHEGDFPGGPAVKNPPSTCSHSDTFTAGCDSVKFCFVLFFPKKKNPPSNAGDTSSIPDQGTRIPHAMGPVSLCTTTSEPF